MGAEPMAIQFDYTRAFIKGAFERKHLTALGGALKTVQKDL
jgi:hypothetical protein